MKKAAADWSYSGVLNQDVLQDWQESTRLEATENVTENDLFEVDEDEEDDAESLEIFEEHMDIQEPIRVLRDMLAAKVSFSLNKYAIWLQNNSQLNINKNMADQCVQGEGLVQINCQIHPKEKKINIVDILQPSDELLAQISGSDSKSSSRGAKRSHDGTATPALKMKNVNWAIDNAFNREKIRLKIPDEPLQWTKAHVRFWLEWAKKQFSQASIKPQDWNLTGEQVCKLTLVEFNRMVPTDPGDLFWTHIELLRTCKFVAVQHKNGPPTALLNSANKKDKVARKVPTQQKQQGSPASTAAVVKRDQNQSANLSKESINLSSRFGTNGQIQLWQFLLELLTDVTYYDIIQWTGEEGEFKLLNADTVSILWGARKNKPNMNYEKLSRALRYYYDGDMLAKITGKRFVYKFICDLEALIGYTSRDLAALIYEQKQQQS